MERTGHLHSSLSSLSASTTHYLPDRVSHPTSSTIAGGGRRQGGCKSTTKSSRIKVYHDPLFKELVEDDQPKRHSSKPGGEDSTIGSTTSVFTVSEKKDNHVLLDHCMQISSWHISVRKR